jgi:uncharacterized protein (TIGR02266 family)
MTFVARIETPEFTEKRDGTRIAVALEVGLSSDSQFFTGITGDISQGGLFVSTYRAMSVGTEVELTFSLPNAAVIKTLGRVRWVRSTSAGAPPGIGVSFEALSSEDRALIEAFCAARVPLYHDDE